MPVRFFQDLRFVAALTDTALGQPLDNRWLDLYSLQFLVEGSMRFGRDHGAAVVLRAPVLYWIEPTHSYQLAPIEGDDRRHFVNFRGERGQRLILEGVDSLDHAGFWRVRQVREMEDLFVRIKRCLAEPSPERHAQAVVLLESVFVLLLASGRGEAVDPHRDAIQALALRIREEPDRDYDLHEEAERLCLSYSHLRRLCRRTLGRPPHDYVLLCRMRQAAAALEDPGRQIKEVAWRSGYEDPAQFSRTFKKMIGLSPQRYREALG